MTTLFLDFETYYDDEYSLSKIPTPNYILDPRFECSMCAVRIGYTEPAIVHGANFQDFIRQFDPASTVTVAHNALFDNSILAWKYDFRPALMLDTMGMARALEGHKLTSASLDSVAKYFGLPAKGGMLPKVKGLRASEIKEKGLWDEFVAYAIHDVDLCSLIFSKMIDRFPVGERVLMDLVLRCTTEPKFIVDTTLFEEHLIDIRKEKDELLKACGVTVDDLMSADRFKAALEAVGVEVQFKTSPTGRTIPCFARTDQFMQDLLEDENPAVQALAAARLGHKSTLEETRTEKLLSIAQLPWPPGLGTMPVPLAYGRAHTHRLAGEWKMNMQNLPTHRGSKGKSKIRKGLQAPPDHTIVVGDLSQIEARLTAWICNAGLLLRQFASKEDPYAGLASKIFGREINRKVDIPEGFIGKIGILGAQYGCGAAKFYNMVKMQSRQAGIDLGDIWHYSTAVDAIYAYRTMHYQIPDGWRRLDSILHSAWLTSGIEEYFGPVRIEKGKVWGPNGLALNYNKPEEDPESQDLWYTYGSKLHKIYGAKLLENIIQFLARIIIMDAANRLASLELRFVLQAHDELVFVVPDLELDEAVMLIHKELVRQPTWAPGLPLAAEIGTGQSYGDAK